MRQTLPWVLLAVRRLPTTSMTTEFDLPCVDCGQELVRQRITTGSGGDVTVAQCPNCGSQYYPEDALGRI